MPSEQFDRLVDRIQTRYGSRRLALRLRIALWVALGYAGFLTLLLLVLAIAAGLTLAAFLGGKTPGIWLIALVSLLLTFGFAQAVVFLWVPLEAEKARELLPDEAPRLFELLDSLRSQMHARRFDHVRLSSDFNAGVQVIPRLGVFGWNRSYLTLGLPLMRALTPEQFSTVLAHEFAHASSGHDRFGMWIYRLRLTWSRVFLELHSPNAAGVVQGLRRMILWFVDWYWPRFNAYAFVLSRANEYEADQEAARLTGVQPTASALFNIACLGNRMREKFFDEVRQQARVEPVVPDDYVHRLESFFRKTPDAADASRWVEQAASTLTGNEDTHPSLSDRLRSLGLSVSQFAASGFPTLPTLSAAEALLGSALEPLTRDVNRQWQTDNSLDWHGVHHHARRLERELQTTAERKHIASGTGDAPSVPEIDVEQMFRRIRTVCELQGVAAAAPFLRELLAVRPNHAAANATLGRYLLSVGEPQGEECLRRILEEEDNDLIPVACAGLMEYFQKSGDADKVRAIRERLSRFEQDKAAALAERGSVTAADHFAPHRLTESELQELASTLARQPDLHSAWLVQKELTHFRRQKLFVLVAHSSPSRWTGSTNAERDRQVVARLIDELKLPGRVLVVAPQAGFRPLARSIMKHPEWRVFPVKGEEMNR